MGKNVETQFAECLKNGNIKKFAEAKKLIEKELRVAKGDLEIAGRGIENGQWKWSTIQAYYSMFHCARALLYSAGYREKSHRCLRVAIETLFVKTGEISEKFIDALQTAKEMRENADYEEEFSETGARKLVSIAGDFFDAVKKKLEANSV